MLARGLLLPVGLFDAYVASLRLQVVDLGRALPLLSVGTETVLPSSFSWFMPTVMRVVDRKSCSG